MFSRFAECGQLFQQHMLRNGPCAAPVCLDSIPLSPPHSETILKKRCHSQKDLNIACLLNVLPDSQYRPVTVIHPDSLNSIAIRLEFSRTISNDGGIRPVQTDSTKIGDQVIRHFLRLAQKQSQRILPQVTPASSALSVIVMRQERASINSTQRWLNSDPAQNIVKV